MTEQTVITLTALPCMAAIVFAHPVMLAGLAAIAVPIAIHLINRGLPRTVVFPTVRFLRAASASQTRPHRLRHLVLMTLRCAFLALLALAFARPLWFASAGAATDADRDTVAIVLLDVSASTGYADSPVSTMSEAVTQAAAVADSLDPARGDRLNVVLAGISPWVLYPRPTSSLAAIKARLEAIRPTAERANASGAIALAAGQFAEFRPSRKELHVISDFQRTNWADIDFTPLPTDTNVILHRIGRDAPQPNACIADVVMTPPQPIATQPCQVNVRLINYSANADRRNVVLRTNDGREWKRTGVALAPGAPADVSFDVVFEKPGIYEFTAEIAPDALAVDDRRFASVHVVTRLPVVLCTDADLHEGVTSSYLLARALAPFSDERGTIELRTVRSRELSTATLTGAEVVLLDASGPVPSGGIRALYEFLRAGGGVAAFLGFGAAVENLVALNDLAPDHDVLPLDLARVRERGAEAGIQKRGSEPPTARVVVNPVAIHPLLRPLGDAGVDSLLSVRVYRHFATRPVPAAGDSIATFDTGGVALAARSIGGGRLLVCGISPDPQWSDLAKHAVFPGLIHQFVGFLRPRQSAQPRVYAGMPVTQRWFTTAPLTNLDINGPGGERIQTTVHREGTMAAVTLPPANAPGFWRIRDGGKVVEGVAVNVDPQESDLASADMNALQSRASAVGRTTAPAMARAEVMKVERRGRPLWHWALGASLAMLAIEMMCLLAWRR